MKKLTILLSFLFLFGCAGMKKQTPTDYTKMFEKSATATQMFGRSQLTGGTSSVDNITTMANGDLCIVITDAGVLYFYRYNSSNTDAEGSDIPGVDPIEPDSVGTGAWEMIKSFALGKTTQPGEAFRDSNTADGDVTGYFYNNCTDVGTGAENCEIYLQAMKDGVLSPVNPQYPVSDDSTDNNIDKSELNGWIYDNDGDTWNLPDIDASDGTGWHVCFYSGGANVVTVNPDDEDIIIDTFDDGAPESAGVSLDNDAAEAAGDIICLTVMYFSSDVAYWAVTYEHGTWGP